MASGRASMAVREITRLMIAYRECSRNLWNVYFSQREDIGGSLDTFGQIRELLFDALVLSELPYGDSGVTDGSPPVLNIVPKERAIILINRSSGPGEAGYWDQEKDMVVGPSDITLAFLDYFDFSQAPLQDFQYFRCRVVSFPSHSDYEGREALLAVTDAKVFYDDQE